MRITRLEVDNFRAIKSAVLDNLTEMVVVAGPNGCGKSCLFDAIRLLKSSYGGYRRDEWQQWFGEFKIDLTGRSRKVNPRALLQDPTREMRVALRLELDERELDYLRENSPALIEDALWEEQSASLDPAVGGTAPLAREVRLHRDEVNRRKTEELEALTKPLAEGAAEAEIRITPDLSVSLVPSPLLELAFSTYAPQHLGVLDYHGAHRTYGREQLGGINLNIKESSDRLSQHALYNYAGKYSNIKSEMASSYVRSLLMKEAGHTADSRDVGLVDTLQELFATFFPGKKFAGPRPTAEGGFDFKVELESGASHDIDELSSGEKEVLYGYLRLRSSAPRNSILLLDEPELHLNPRLVKGLSLFYDKHLGHALNNQIWLVTHSDALLREAVEQPSFRVFHMRSPTEHDPTQIRLLAPEEDVEKAIIDLVGDLAAYRPGAKVVIFEGGGDSEFDVRMTEKLFPDFYETVNAIPGGNKHRVQGLFRALSGAAKRAQLGARFYCVVDRDADDTPQEALGEKRMLRWDVYHIENYLLEPEYVFQALQDVYSTGAMPFANIEELSDAMKTVAQGTLTSLIRALLQEAIDDELVRCIRAQVDPASPSLAQALHEAVGRSADKVQTTCDQELTLDKLKEREAKFRAQFNGNLADDSWRSTFKGREILRNFAGQYVNGTKYEHFRNLIIAKMAAAKFQPPGMKAVIDKIRTD